MSALSSWALVESELALPASPSPSTSASSSASASALQRRAETARSQREARRVALLSEREHRFGAELSERASLSAELSRIETALNAEENHLSDPNEGLEAEEAAFLATCARLERDIASKTLQLSVYGHLAQCYQNAERFQEHFDKGELIRASRHLVLLGEALTALDRLISSASTTLTTASIPPMAIVSLFQARFTSSKKVTEKRLNALFTEGAHFTQNALRLTSRLRQPSGYEATLAEVVVCLTGLGLIQETLAQFGAKLLSFLEMNVSSNESEWSSVIEVRATPSEDGLSVTLEVTRRALTEAEVAQQSFPTQKLLGSSVKAVGVLMEHLKQRTENPKVSFMAQLRESHLPSFLSSVRDRVLLPLLPKESTKISAFIEAYRSLAAKLDQILTLLGFLQSGETPFLSFVSEIKDKFVARLALSLLDEARSALFAPNTALVTLTGEDEAHAPPKEALNFLHLGISEESFFKFPACKVSQRLVTFIECVRRPLLQVNRSALSVDACLVLYRTARNLLELFLASYEAAHKDIISRLPSAMALFHNDCLFLARRLLTLAAEFRPNFPSPLDEAVTFLDFVEPLTLRAEQTWQSHLESQVEVLEESFEVLGGLADTDQERRRAQVEQGLKQLLHKLTKTSAAWKEVLPSLFYVRSMSRLLDVVLARLSSEVLKLTDIGATECDALSDLLKLMLKVESLVQLPSHTCVPSWQRYRALVSLLTTSLSDIGPLHAAGKLSAIRSDELSAFIKALFADSDKRRALLASLT